jgi:hypothetical protein
LPPETFGKNRFFCFFFFGAALTDKGEQAPPRVNRSAGVIAAGGPTLSSRRAGYLGMHCELEGALSHLARFAKKPRNQKKTNLKTLLSMFRV